MATLGDYFSYNDDYSELNTIYDNLSREMKDIHNSGKVITNFSSSSINFDDGISFDSVGNPVNFELEKRNNIVSNAKMMLGTYLSLSTGFNDFSNVSDEFFTSNLDDICSSITSESFYPEYYYGIFNEGKNEYYCDFLARKKQERDLNGNKNVNSYKKVLSNAASSLYYDVSEEVEGPTLDQKQAKVHSLFYPVLIGVSLLLIVLVVILISNLI
jgi:hypothetical protein